MGPWEHGQPISADFVAPEAQLIIQVDGCYFHECPEHGQGHFPEKPAIDKEKTAEAQAAGWMVLRFWEHEVMQDLEAVLAKIDATWKELFEP